MTSPQRAVKVADRSKEYAKFVDGLSQKLRSTLGAMCTSYPTRHYFTAAEIAHEMWVRCGKPNITEGEKKDLSDRLATTICTMVKNSKQSSRSNRIIRSPGKINPELVTDAKLSYGYRIGHAISERPVDSQQIQSDAKAAQAAFDSQKNMRENVIAWIKSQPISTLTDLLLEISIAINDKNAQSLAKMEEMKHHIQQVEAGAEAITASINKMRA